MRKKIGSTLSDTKIQTTNNIINSKILQKGNLGFQKMGTNVKIIPSKYFIDKCNYREKQLIFN